MEQQTVISLVMGLIAVVTNFVTTRVQLQHLTEKVEGNQTLSDKADSEINAHINEGFSEMEKIKNKIAVLEEKNLQTLTSTSAEQKFVTKEVLDLKLKHIELSISHVESNIAGIKEDVAKILIAVQEGNSNG